MHSTDTINIDELFGLFSLKLGIMMDDPELKLKLLSFSGPLYTLKAGRQRSITGLQVNGKGISALFSLSGEGSFCQSSFHLKVSVFVSVPSSIHEEEICRNACLNTTSLRHLRQ